jgi:hypothetical protein
VQATASARAYCGWASCSGMSRLLGGVEVDVVLHSVGILGQCMRKDRHLGEHELANQDTCSLFNLHGVSVLFTLKLASIY